MHMSFSCVCCIPFPSQINTVAMSEGKVKLTEFLEPSSIQELLAAAVKQQSMPADEDAEDDRDNLTLSLMRKIAVRRATCCAHLQPTAPVIGAFGSCFAASLVDNDPPLTDDAGVV